MIAIVDYGLGNLGSVTKAFRHVGASAVLSADPKVLRSAEALVLPGDGAFAATMEEIRSRDLLPILQETVADAPRGSVADLHRRLACRSALVLPIRVGNTVTGAVSLCYAGSGRTYAATDLADARRIAREIERTPPPLLNATSRLRAATGDARRHATVRRRVAPRN